MRLAGMLLTAVLGGALTARADIATGLVAYYNFEGMAGLAGETVADQSGHGHDGVCRQDQNTLRAPTIVPGPSGLGSALSFDGNFYVQIPNAADFNVTGSVTVAAWVAVDALNQDWETVFCRGDWSWRLHRNSATDFISFHMNGLTGGYGADGGTTDIRAPKRWLHLVGTYQNGGGAALYINGVLEATNSAVSGLINTVGSDPVTIGAQIDSGTLRRQWVGQIDEVRFYNRALTPADVTQLYHFASGSFNNTPTVTATGDLDLDAPTNIPLTAVVSDDGNPLPSNTSNPDPNDPNKLRWGWTALSQPAASAGITWSGATNGEAFTYAGSPNAPWTLFTNSPTAGFDVPGKYVLKFTATDGQYSSSRTIVVRVRTRNDYHALGYAYLSPLPGAEYASPQKNLILMRLNPLAATAITNLSSCIHVTGAVSGAHSGQTKIASDHRTVMFQMTGVFALGEVVTVALSPGIPPTAGGPLAPYQYQYVVAGHWADSAPKYAEAIVAPMKAQVPSPPAPLAQPVNASIGVAGIMPNGVSVPSDFPWISITTSNNPDPNPIFIDNRGGGGDPFNVIFDNSGAPIWYCKYPDERRDMKVQPNGLLTMLARDNGNHYNSFDTNYQLVTNYWAANGFSVDEHEFQMRPDGSYFVLVITTGNVDMSRYVAGGNPNAAVTECALQEFTPQHELIMEWRAWEHFDILDQQAFIDLTANSLDFPHMNAIDVDTDGNILLSSRSTSEVTKINRDTGEIIWRLGGARNQFTYVNDPLQGTRNQHALRMVSTNDYIMFDNGDLHSPAMSRGVEYVLDTNKMTATLVWQYPSTPTPSMYSFYMGDAQRLTNGNTVIDWAVGGLPKLTEVRPDGTKAFEMNWVGGWEAYRTWRCAWHGSATQPYLLVESYPDNISLIYNQFGDTNVAFYKIYGGTTSHSTNLLATSGATLKRLTALQNGATYYFRVTAVNRQGVEGPPSNEQTATVNIIKPGQAMLQNGDFSQGKTSWAWTVAGGASATWAIESGASHVYITNGSSAAANIQLKQTGKALIQGKTYVLQFDGWATGTRYIEAKVAQDASPNQFYGGTTTAFLTPAHNHFRYVFTMAATSDFNASIFFNLGGSTAGVFLDNVSLYYCAPGDLNEDGQVDLLDLKTLTQDWLKQQNGLSTDLDGNGKVDFNDFGILGENW
jgi:hypothetical protein